MAALFGQAKCDSKDVDCEDEMAIESTPFGGVKLTGEDARKFRAQVKFGRPKNTAIEAAKRGVELARELSKNGSIRFIGPLP
jgi:hypothetical protein